MTTKIRALIVICLCSIAVLCQQTGGAPAATNQKLDSATRNQNARTALNDGVRAYKAGDYKTAMKNFEKAALLDPTLSVAHLYLATSYAQQFTPRLETPDNVALAARAIAEYKQVLSSDAGQGPRMNSLKGIAYLYFNMNKLDEAKEYYTQAVNLDPLDPELHYSLAIIDWMKTYTRRMDAKKRLGLEPAEPLEDLAVCGEVRKDNSVLVNEALAHLETAIDLRPDYDDAMAYLNLVYRELADIQCGNPSERTRLIAKADEWVDKTIATKKAKEHQK